MQSLAPEQPDFPNYLGTLPRSKRANTLLGSKRAKLRGDEVARYWSRFLEFFLSLVEEGLVFFVPEKRPEGLNSIKWVSDVSRRLPRLPKCQCVGRFLPKIIYLV